ncbi:MAG TPA: hypothetical protein VFZ42_13160 [Chitinophagaceae bacterium]
MKRIPVFILLVSLLTAGMACKQKKKVSLSGEDPVEISDFISYFQPIELPLQFDAPMMAKKGNDSLLISQKIFRQFVPDSTLGKLLVKNPAWKIYPLGQVEASKDEKYLFAKAIIPKTPRSVALILVFDNKNNFLNAMNAWNSDKDLTKTIQATTVVDKKFTITRTAIRKNADGSVSEGKDIYAFNPESKNFTLIMTDAIGDVATELINPIDTFGRKHKYAADYSTAKTNLVSVRDGRKPDRLNFFIHFEKNNGECNGELKGEAMLRSANLAEYRQGGDPCVLQFRFSAGAVTVRELEGCGSHRDLRCSFDGVYTRKKEAKPKAPVKKASAKK